jgi:hypothetical protein
MSFSTESTHFSRSRFPKAALQQMDLNSAERTALHYRITSSTRSSRDCGIVKPRATN